MASRSWDRRNDAARAAGYKNYYDYRVHDFGRLPPSAPVVAADRPRLRGHRSAADLERDVKEGSFVTYNGSERDPRTGEYKWLEIAVVDAKGKERIYRLRGDQLNKENLQATLAAIGAAGGFLAPSKSLDIAGYANEEPPDDPDELELDLGPLPADYDEFEGLF